MDHQLLYLRLKVVSLAIESTFTILAGVRGVVFFAFFSTHFFIMATANHSVCKACETNDKSDLLYCGICDDYMCDACEILHHKYVRSGILHTPHATRQDDAPKQAQAVVLPEAPHQD